MALAWFLQKKLYQKNWQKNLKIQVSFQDSAIYEGEESTLKEVIVNDKLLPIPALELGISMSRNLEFDREAKANASITDQSEPYNSISVKCDGKKKSASLVVYPLNK